MAIKKDTEEKKNGMKVTDNMDGDKNADKKLMAGVVNPFTQIEQMELKKLGYSRALKNPSIMSSKGKEMGIKILKDILSVNKQR